MFKQLSEDPSLPVSKPTPSYWQAPPHPTLLDIKSTNLPSQRDIIIIGSGITSCSVSRELFGSGYRGTITVLEARQVCSGATGRNGGRINCVAVQDFDKYSKLFGVETAKVIVRFELAHYDVMLQAAHDLGQEGFARSEVRPVETIAAVFSDKKLQELKAMLENFEASFPDLAGRWKVVDAEAQEVYGIQKAKGALIGSAGAASAYRLVTEVFAQILDKHKDTFSIETNTPVTEISRRGPEAYPYILNTPRGTIQAKNVIHCTEGHVSHLVPNLRGILVPCRGQMSVLNPGTAFEDSKGRRSWSLYFNQGFDYMSQNEHTGELFVGGGELGGFDSALETHGVASDAEENIAAKSHLAGILPVAFGPEGWGQERAGKPLLKASWVGILCNSIDRVPLVGLLPQEALGARSAGDRETGAEWISAGYGGYGMVNAWLCGKAVALQVLGQPVPSWLPKVYESTPQRLVALRKQLLEIQGSTKHLKALL